MNEKIIAIYCEEVEPTKNFTAGKLSNGKVYCTENCQKQCKYKND